MSHSEGLLPPDLEDWLSAEADRILATEEPYSGVDGLIHELWLFDTEFGNGGASQYFCNFPERWPLLLERTGSAVPEFAPVATAVSGVLDGSEDPCESALEREDELDDVYSSHRVAILSALRKVASTTRPV